MAKKTLSKSAKPAGKPAAGPSTKPAVKRASAKTDKPAAKNSSKKAVAISAVLTEGGRAPDFELPRDGGKRVSLADYAGGKLVIFFYPRADTPGCTKEAIDFTRLSASFAKAKTSLLGVSADPARAQEAFRDKHRLSMPLASDETQTMLSAYGVWGEKSMYGKTFMGIVRTTVLLDADAKILKIWRNVKVDGHADDVLATAQIA